MRKGAFRFFGGIAVLTLLAGGVAHARTQKFTSSTSGTIVDIPLDPDADSCTTSGTLTVCTDFSAYFTSSAKGTGGIGGESTSQAVEEYDAVSGSGCTIMGAPAPIASCTLAGSSETGCEFKSVSSAIVSRDSATGDLLFQTESTTVCLDLSTGPPLNSTAAANGTITGGTGKFLGATGKFTAVAHGQTLVSDPAGHGFTWFEGSSTGTITKP
jgi:hypothetical protein